MLEFCYLLNCQTQPSPFSPFRYRLQEELIPFDAFVKDVYMRGLQDFETRSDFQHWAIWQPILSNFLSISNTFTHISIHFFIHVYQKHSNNITQTPLPNTQVLLFFSMLCLRGLGFLFPMIVLKIFSAFEILSLALDFI